MSSEAAATTVVVVTWRGVAHVGACLDALSRQHRRHHVLVVDNASDDGTAAVLTEHPSSPEVLRLSRNSGYAGGIAAALARVRTPFMAWLNDDTRPDPGWLAALEEAMTDDVAAVASRMYHPGGGTHSLGVALTADGHGRDTTVEDSEPFGFCGGAALLRTGAVREVGGVPAYFFCYYEDTDTAWRLRLAGWRTVTARHARVCHHHGASSVLGSPQFHRWNERNRLLMLLRCAPAGTAVGALAWFTARTLAAAARSPRSGRNRSGQRTAPNFRPGLRSRVLIELLAAMPATLRGRHRIGRDALVSRGAVWRRWSGR